MTGDAGLRRLTIVSAGVGEPSSSARLAGRLAVATQRALDARGVPSATTTVEVRDLAHDVVTATLTRFVSPALEAALLAVGAADGLVVVSPIFNASFGGLFKSLVDLVEPAALDGRPVLIGATGGSARHALALDHALRPLLSSLHALVLPTGVFAVSGELGADTDADPAPLAARIARAGSELGAAIAARPAIGADLDLEELLVAAD